MSRYRDLLPTQKNDVTEALLSAGLQPNGFDWETAASIGTNDTLVRRLFHQQTRLFFRFDVTREGSYLLRFSPGVVKGEDQLVRATWPDVVRDVRPWASRVKREVDAPDLWAEATKERALSTAVTAAENSTFTRDERDLLRVRLDELADHLVTTHHLAGQEREYVNAQLDYLKGALDRLGKKDWLTIFRSVLIGFAVDRVVPPGAVGELMRFAWTLVQVVFGIPPELPPPAG